MGFHLTDLDELVQKVRNSHSQNYLKEAIVSYRAGAYRASVIATWIAVCVDIIEKIRELSLSGDGAAKVIDDRLNGIQPGDINSMLLFEREILEFACDQLQLISVIEKAHLEQLKDDRNICAHPTFSADGSQFTPVPELTRAYIVQAANYLLIQTPVKGRVIVDRLYDLVKEESFPSDDEKAFAVLSSDAYLGRVRESSVRNFEIILLKRLFKDDDGISIDLLNKLAAALAAIQRMHPIIYADVLRTKLSQMLAETNDKQLKRVFPFLIKRSDSWNKIENAVIIRMQGSINAMNVDELVNCQITKLASLIPVINQPFQDRVEKLSRGDIQKLLEASPARILLRFAIKIFVESGSFDSAYRNGMHIMVPYGKFLTNEDIKHLFTGVFANQRWNINQILNAGGIDEVFSQIYRDSKNNLTNGNSIWKEFWDKAKGGGHSYETLKSLLIEDGIIEIEPVIDQEHDDDFPL